MSRKLSWLLIGLVLLVSLYVVAVFLINSALDDDDLAGCQSVGSGVCDKADVIVVVSGGDTVSRTNHAVDMVLAGWADKLILSGASADPKSISNAEAMRQIALSRGVSDQQILIDKDSKNTQENAQNSIGLINDINAKKVILVSSPYHLRRVRSNFIAVDSSIQYRTSAADDQAWHWWFLKPTGWRLAVTELAGNAKIKAESVR